jgi:dipeptidyl aminopeptidase/acylaminoacyl peptidase
MEIEDVLFLSSVADPQISPDGKYVAYVVTERDEEENINDSDIWIVATEGGDPIRLTYHKGTDDSPRWAPDGSWLGFVSDRGETSQVFGILPHGGEAWPVTDWQTDVESFLVSHDGARIAFVAKPEKSEEQEQFEKERGRPDVWDEFYPDEWSHLWVAALEEGRAQAAERFSPDGLYVSDFIWAPDSKRLAFAGRPSPTLRARSYGNVYIVDKAGGESRQVTYMSGGESPVAWTEAHGLIVSGTGQVLGTYNSKLWKVPVSGGEAVSLTDGLDEHAGFVAITRERLLVEASNRTGRGLCGIDLKSGKVEWLTDDARFRQRFSATEDASKVAFLSDSGSEPTNVYVSSTESIAPKRLTDVNPQMAELMFGEQKVVRWSSRADGEEIEGVLTLPVGYREGESVPLLLVIHGGPSGVSSDRFSPRRSAYPIQVFAGKGYAVLEPNYRGSTGYGERFRGLNRGDISGKDWVDIDSGVDALIEQGIADPDRLGIMGWSFGGHHTYWGITQTHRYKAASAGAGANDLISMYSQTDLPDFYHTYLGPKPWEDFDLYEERSAYRNVAKVTTPLLIQVGEKDERVPAEQSIQFYEAVKSMGKVETKLVIYPGQPHGVRDPRLVRDLMLRNVEWFTRWIPTDNAGATDGGR